MKTKYFDLQWIGFCASSNCCYCCVDGNDDGDGGDDGDDDVYVFGQLDYSLFCAGAIGQKQETPLTMMMNDCCYSTCDLVYWWSGCGRRQNQLKKNFHYATDKN